MKKIFLIALTVALFACALALSVSAKDIDKQIETDYTYKGEKLSLPIYDKDGNALVWIRQDDITKASANGTPFKDVFKNNNSEENYYEISHEDSTYYLFCRKTSDSYKVSNGLISIISGKGISAGKIVVLNLDGMEGQRIELRMEGVLEYAYLPASLNSTLCKTDKQTFNGCASLKEIEFAQGSQITEIGSAAFKGTALTSIVLPEGVTTLSNNAFNGSSSLKSVYISKNTVVTQTETGSTGLAGVSGVTVYFTGTEADRANWDAALTDINVEYVNHCDVYYDGEHQVGDTTCTRCGKIAYCDNAEHEFEVNISYEDYTENGVKTVICSTCNSLPMESSTDPLFVNRGYATKENGGGDIVIGFEVKKSAIAEYEAVTKKTVEYGLFAVSRDKLKADPLNSDGSGADGVIKVELTSYDFAVFELKITGFTKDEYKTVEIAMGAYIIVTVANSGEKEISYLQSGTVDEGEKYSFISYYDIYPTTEQ